MNVSQQKTHIMFVAAKFVFNLCFRNVQKCWRTSMRWFFNKHALSNIANVSEFANALTFDITNNVLRVKTFAFLSLSHGNGMNTEH